MKQVQIKTSDKDKIKGIIINIIDNQKKDAYIANNYNNIPKKGKESITSLSR